MAKHTLKSCGVNTARFLKYVWPFYNIIHERVKEQSHSEHKIKKGKETPQNKAKVKQIRYLASITVVSDLPKCFDWFVSKIGIGIAELVLVEGTSILMELFL